MTAVLICIKSCGWKLYSVVCFHSPVVAAAAVVVVVVGLLEGYTLWNIVLASAPVVNVTAVLGTHSVCRTLSGVNFSV